MFPRVLTRSMCRVMSLLLVERTSGLTRREGTTGHHLLNGLYQLSNMFLQWGEERGGRVCGERSGEGGRRVCSV